MSPLTKGIEGILMLISVASFPSLSSSFPSSNSPEPHPHSPCNFDPRCSCSVGAAEYGSVVSDGIPLADIPIELQESRVFQLKLRNNQLHRFPDAKLSSCGMWGLEVSHNPIEDIPSMAFYGLERALWELNLSNNRLTKVPSESINLLQKLTVLILSDNHISELRRSDLRSLATSLKSLDLSGNGLTSVPEGIFWDLQRLEILDLSRNNIIHIHSMAFKNGVPLLYEIKLSDNLMGKVPFVSIGHVKSLRNLDLSKNRIEKIEDPFFKSKLTLNVLDLSENNLETLNPKAFQNFAYINFTSLSSNPLRDIKPGAFSETHMKHLDLSNCYIHSLEPDSLRGLQTTLEHLDLSANRLSELADDLFNDFDLIRTLKLNDNMLSLSPNISFNGFRYAIKNLQLQGEDMQYVPLEEISIMRNLRTVRLSAVKNYGSLSPGQFESFAPSLEELNLVDSDITSLDSQAFKHVPSVSRLDLSNNRIEFIDDDAFREVGNALVYLKMSNALYFTQIPSNPFQSLTGLQTLDLSNNHIRKLPLDAFHKMSRLQYLYLQDNEISTFQMGTFHSQANPCLAVLDLSFNKIPFVDYDTFRFPELKRLSLNDNQITTLNRRSFVDMTKLVILSLQGNDIQHLSEETFQNLHHLQRLDLSWNSLTSLNFAAFDSVGTLSHLSIDLSHNLLEKLRVNQSNSFPTLSNIMRLDLSYNNISHVEATFFEPIRNELKVLNLSHNSLSEISPDDIGQLKRLHCLDLSHNILSVIEPTTFMSARKLKSVSLSHNRLLSLNPTLFNSQNRLQYVDLSYNGLTSLPEQIFQRTDLEMFLASHNQLNEIPIKALNLVQSTLKYLDLSGNAITTISDSQLNQIQLLVALKLAHNHISSIDREAFCCVPNLQYLDLSHNPLRRVDPDTFLGIEAHLHHLNLANTSLTLLPSLQLPRLKALNISKNLLTFVPPNTLVNLSEVRDLDLSFNQLPTPPSSAWHSMHYLRSLRLSGNPIKRVTNDSFVGLRHLEKLDISSIDAGSFQTGSFGTMPNLRYLQLQLHSKLGKEFNLASLLTHNQAISHLHLHISKQVIDNSGSSDKDTVLRHSLQESLPKRLSQITLEGDTIDKLHPAAFKHLRSRRLRLNFKAYRRLNVDRDLFLNLGQVQNLSVTIEPKSLKDLFNITQQRMRENQLGNPITTYSPNHPRAVFMDNLDISGSQWPCTCDGIGWSEKWLRRWKDVYCGHELSIYKPEKCSMIEKSFRSATCRSRHVNSAKPVLEALKSDLECQAFNKGSSRTINIWIAHLTLLASVIFNSRKM